MSNTQPITNGNGKQVNVITKSMGVKGVTTTQSGEEIINVTILSCLRFHKVDNARIKRYMPRSYGRRPKHLLLILMAVRGLNRVTKTMLITELGLNANACIAGVDYLVSVGYLKPFGKPRLIVPFQRYKVDTGYTVTAKGNEVISALLS